MEELVNADAVDAFRVGANVLLDLAALAGETGRTVAAEVTNEVSAVGPQEARLLRAVVDVDVAKNTLPSVRTLADKTTLDEKDHHFVKLRPLGKLQVKEFQ